MEPIKSLERIALFRRRETAASRIRLPSAPGNELIVPAQWICLFLMLVAISGCAGVRSTPDDSALEFPAAVKRMTALLLYQIQADQFLGLVAIRDRVSAIASRQAVLDGGAFVIDPFIDGDSGNVTMASNTITDIVSESMNNSGRQYRVLPFTYRNLQASRYVVTGAVRYEASPIYGAKLYHLYGSIIDVLTGQVLANASTWVSNSGVDDRPIKFYKSSPMYLMDASVSYQLATALAPEGARAQAYVDTLAAKAVTSEGAAALDRGDYRGAVKSFDISLHLPNGRTMKNYAGLYQAYFNLGDEAAAERAFYELFALGVASDNVKIKFMFNVDTSEFITNQDSRIHYVIWLRQIAKYVADSQVCIRISGHTSHSGSREYSYRLSFRRARRVEDALLLDSPKIAARLSTIGWGFDKNIIGSGTDDDRDMIDRRVELRPVSCGVTFLSPVSPRSLAVAANLD